MSTDGHEGEGEDANKLESSGQGAYEDLCASAVTTRRDPAWVDDEYRRRYGVLPSVDGRRTPQEFRTYRDRYSGKSLTHEILDASHTTSLGRQHANLLVALVQAGHSGRVLRSEDYALYSKLCRVGWAQWKVASDHIEFFPSRKALASMERAHEDRPSIDGAGDVPSWDEVRRQGRNRPTIGRGTWYLALVGSLWCAIFVWMLISLRAETFPETDEIASDGRTAIENPDGTRDPAPDASGPKVTTANSGSGTDVPGRPHAAAEPSIRLPVFHRSETTPPKNRIDSTFILFFTIVTVGGGILIFSSLRPEVRALIESRVVTTANVAIIISGLIVPVAASLLIQDYRKTQIQADLAKVLMDHLSKGANDNELSTTQLSLMIALLEENAGKFDLRLTRFASKLREVQQQRTLEASKSMAKKEEQEKQARANEVASLKAERNASSRELAWLNVEIKRLQGAIGEHEAEIQKLEISNKPKDTQKLRALRNQKQKLQDELSVQKDKLQKADEKRIEVDQELQSMEKELEQQKKRVEELEARAIAATKAAEKEAAAVESERYTALAAELEAIKARETKLRQELQNLRDSCIPLQGEIRSVVTQYSGLAAKFADPEQKLDAKELVKDTASMGLHAIDALEDSGVSLDPEIHKKKEEFEQLIKLDESSVADTQENTTHQETLQEAPSPLSAEDASEGA